MLHVEGEQVSDRFIYLLAGFTSETTVKVNRKVGGVSVIVKRAKEGPMFCAGLYRAPQHVLVEAINGNSITQFFLVYHSHIAGLSQLRDRISPSRAISLVTPGIFLFM